MPGAGSHDAALNRTADERHVANDVEQLVTSAFVFPLEGLRLDVANLRSIHVRYFQQIGKIVELLLADLTLIDDDGVFEVATLDKVGIEQRHDVAYEDKRTGGSNLLRIVMNVVERSELAIDELRLEGAHGRDGEFFVRQNSDARPAFFVPYFNFLANDIIILLGILFFDTHFLNFFHIHNGRAIEDRELGTIDLDKAVVDAKGIESRETVLNGRYANVALGKDGATLSVDHLFG